MSLDGNKFSAAIWPSTRVRNAFVDFFCQKHAHQNIKSSAVVPFNDPTLLFTNSGMAQFKAVFLGQVEPNSPLAGVKRVANTQKCIRAGGKHNDLDDVGKDSYHHTFFEMLGSWSFGDYFKTDAIDWAWQLLTEVYGLPPERIYTTYFRGDEKNKIPRDDEARDRWLKYLPADHVLPFGAKENFWEMGDTGPCGPCTEIHFDLKGGRDASALVNADDPTVIEIWNLVFMQFQRNADTSLTPLPNKHVDTGAGLERFVGVLQNKMSNYESDLFGDLFIAIQQATGDEAGYTNKYGAADKDSHDMAYRVIADHIRTLTFALTDGAVPDSEGRGYVLRRIVRRAVRYGTQTLKAPPGFFHKLVPAVVAKMADVFPEITQNTDKVTAIIKREEELFLRTLENGTKRLTKVLEKLDVGPAGKKTLAGAEMWDMYSTFGFPPDLTELMCNEKGVVVDKPGYEAASAAFRVQRNAGTSGAVAMPALDMHGTDHLQKTRVMATNDSPKYNPEERSVKATVVALFQNGAFTDKLAADKTQYAGVVLDRTNFYAEAGGQVADVGSLRINNADVFDVADAQNYAGYVLHVGRVRDGAAPLVVGDSITTLIDGANRARVTSNHTTTHMLNWALRRTCGTSVEQKGSKVVAELLRFDFAHDGAVGVERITKVDEIVNDVIGKNMTIYAKEVPIALARGVNGLTAVFGEKYPDPVRMVAIGVPVDDLIKIPDYDWGSKYSIEFCGGTHLATTGLAASYVTISESGIAQGVRRVVGVTGAEATAAQDAAAAVEKRLVALEALDQSTTAANTERVALLAEVSSGTLPFVFAAKARDRVDALVRAHLNSKKDRATGEKSSSEAFIQQTLAAHKESPLPFVVANLPDLGGNSSVLLTTSFTLSNQGVPNLLVSAEPEGKKAKVVVVATSPAGSKIAAGAWCQAAVASFGGKGGGKADKGQGSHDQLTKGAETAEKAKEFAASATK